LSALVGFLWAKAGKNLAAYWPTGDHEFTMHKPVTYTRARALGMQL